MRLALFPLSAHLLPGGIMPLRIFEPRYLRMVAEAGEVGFALCMVDPRQPDALRNMLPIATRVNVIDFDRLPDGMLGITVQGVERVQIEDLWQEQDGLRIGEVTSLPAWPPRRLHPDQLPLADALREVLTAKNSTPSMRSRTMCSTAFPPPPPTPMTLITASLVSSIGSNIMSLRFVLTIEANNMLLNKN